MIRIEFRSNLSVARGKLLTGRQPGTPVHAGAFLRKGLIVLDSGLKKCPPELDRILAHELFHFIWWRLGNPKRRSWESLLSRERSRGELGWSAERLKLRLSGNDKLQRTRAWREYCCESFCDSGASYVCRAAKHAEFTLAQRDRRTRHKWLEAIILNEANLAQLISLKSGRRGVFLPAGLCRLLKRT